MFAKVSCDEKESIEEQKCITRSTIVPAYRANRLTCALWIRMSVGEDLVCIQELNS